MSLLSTEPISPSGRSVPPGGSARGAIGLSAVPPRDGPEQPIAAGGEMETLIAATDWSKTPLGPVEAWSPALRMMVNFLLANRFPLLLWWGPRYISIYNDAYRSVLGTKHPWALGRPVSEVWSEIWHVLEPLIDTPFAGGPATWMEDIELHINRHGFLEESHFTIAYSPVPDETAARGIGGVLATVHEITEKVSANGGSSSCAILARARRTRRPPKTPARSPRPCCPITPMTFHLRCSI